MAYEIETKDGIVIRGIPDTVKPDDPSLKAKVANARFQRDAANPDYRKAGEMAMEGMTTGDKFDAGVGKAVVDAGRGIKQLGRSALDVIAPRSPTLSGLVTGQDPSRSAEDMRDYGQTRARDAALMDSGAGMTGNIVGNVGIALVPGGLLKGASMSAAAGRAAPALSAAGSALLAPRTIAGAAALGAGMGAIQPVAMGGEREVNVGVGAAAGGVGKAAGDRIAQALANRVNPSRYLATQAQNAPRDAAMAAGRDAGYVLPPSQANDSVVNRVLESLPGKAGTQQAASLKNQAITDRLAKQALGMADNAPLTEQSLQNLRRQAGKAYEAVKSLPGKIKTDADFAKQVASLGNDFEAAAKEFPEIVRNESVEALQKALTKPEITPRAAVELVKKLRFDASKNFKAFDDPAKAALAQAQRGAANAIDDLVERSLAQSGDTTTSQAYRAARVLIAKAHDVESALNESTGHVSAKALAKVLEKGKPLTGELETAARFARSFPTATQNTERLSSVLGGTPLDWVMGGGAAAATGNPAMLAAALARPAVRSMLVSAPYQKLMAGPQTYAPGTSVRLAEALARRARPVIPAASAAAALNAVQQ
jgi:hypothetical protein